MKSKITKRLVITNLLILITALLCFYLVSVYNLNTQAREQAEQQIFAESSTIAERTTNTHNIIGNIRNENIQNNDRPIPAVYKQDTFIFPSKNDNVSIHIFCQIDENSGELIFPEKNANLINRIKLDEQAESEISELTLDEAEIVSIENENYLVLLTEHTNEESKSIIVSLLAMETINTLTTSNIISFGITFVLLIVLAFLLISWQSVRITKPLKMLTNRSEKYANQDYSESFAVNTGDEIESLSHSIQSMVESIIAHEKSQTALFRNLSHELKTPLTAISGYAQNIENGYYKNNESALKIIQEECDRIRNILDNLIFLSKIDSNVENFTFEKHNIVDLVTASIEKVESIAILNDIDLLYTPHDELIISCDNEKIIRALINILSNALKHTKDYVMVNIADEIDNIAIIIMDNGCGFDKNKLDKLFLTSTGESVDGSGIGLLIVYEIVKKHGGKIQVKNLDQGGAEICVFLPKSN